MFVICHNFTSMKIVDILKNKNGFLIKLENNGSLTILESIKDEFNLYINKDIDESTIFKIKNENKIQSLFELCQKRLTLSNYSLNKMKEFLFKKGASKKESDKVISKLEKYSLVNEDEIINNVISYCDAKHYGFNRIVSMLKQRQITTLKIASLKYNLIREEKEAVLQRQILERKYKNKNTKNLKKSIYSALIRYGFNEEIASYNSSLVHNSTINELNMLKLNYHKLFSSYSRKLNEKELNDKIINKLISKGYSYSDIKRVMEE